MNAEYCTDTPDGGFCSVVTTHHAIHPVECTVGRGKTLRTNRTPSIFGQQDTQTGAHTKSDVHVQLVRHMHTCTFPYGTPFWRQDTVKVVLCVLNI